MLGDSHRDIASIDMIGDLLRKAELVIHTGDNYEDLNYIKKQYNTKAIGVKGNCDWEKDVVEERIEMIENKKIFITHGHRYNVKSGLNAIFYKGKELEADIVIFGHSHIPVKIIEEDMILLNPGSISRPRGNSSRSYATLEIKDRIKVEIVKLRKREKNKG